jgi:tRNA (guanine37-N1)-methyltransferase
LSEESFENGLLEHDQYTLPRQWGPYGTPDVLLSGDHKRIAEWRLNSAKALTKQRRPDLYAAYSETHDIQAPETGDEHY